MSSPIDRSFDPDSVSPYAPKWARDLDGVTKWARDLDEMARKRPAGLPPPDEDAVSMVPSDDPEMESDRLPLLRTLDPIVVSEPLPEAWSAHSPEYPLRRSGVGGYLRFLFFVLLAAMIALVIVVELPTIQHMAAQWKGAAKSVAARADSAAPSPAGPWSTASEPKPADHPPSNVERRIAALDPPATTPVVRTTPVAPAAETPAPAQPTPAASAPANPAPVAAAIAAAPSVANAAPSPAPSVNTVPIKPEKPARPLGNEEIETLLQQGQDFVSVGDFASARIVFGRVAEAGDARGALALAATYDPVLLAKIGAKGARPDVAKAREWYVKARDLGSPDAAKRLEALASVQ